MNVFSGGYDSVRPFSDEERALIPQLTAIIRAFWLLDIYYGENSLTKLTERGDMTAAGEALARIERTLCEDINFNF